MRSKQNKRCYPRHVLQTLYGFPIVLSVQGINCKSRKQTTQKGVGYDITPDTAVVMKRRG